ncbi:MAG: hypothetical protein ACEPO2_09870 [Pelagibaca sp.]
MTKGEEPELVSNMTYSELVQFYNTQMGRVEMTWFRIMYLHAAMVGVLVFFGEAADFLALQRAIVFAFYSVNLLIFFFALRDGYGAMQSVLNDLFKFPDKTGSVNQWFSNQRLAMKPRLYTLVMISAWLFVLLLLFYSLFTG